MAKNLLKDGFSFSLQEQKLWIEFFEEYLHLDTTNEELESKNNELRTNFLSVFSKKRTMKP